MLRLLLPPNLPAAAARDAIPVKVELDLAREPAAALLPGLAILQRLGVEPKPVLFLQLKRAPLRELVAALAGQPVFFRIDQPGTALLWLGPKLRGVSEHLEPAPGEVIAPTPAPAPSTAPAARSPLSGPTAPASGAPRPIGARPTFGARSAPVPSPAAPATPAPVSPPAPLRRPIEVPRELDSPRRDSAPRGYRSSAVPPLSRARSLEFQARRAAEQPVLTPMSVDGSEHFLAIGLPSRDSAIYPAALDLVKNHGFTLDPSTRKYWLRDRHKVLNFLAVHGARLRTEFRPTFSANFEQNMARITDATITTDAAATTDASGEFEVTLGLDAAGADDASLREALASGRHYVEKAGRIALLPPEKLAQFAAAQRALAGDLEAALAPRRKQRLSTARLAEAEDLLAQLSPHFQPPAAWRERTAALRSTSALPPAPVPAALEVLLRPYQRLGVAWLWHLYRHELGGVLADEMGLGKTLQAIALLSALRATRSVGSRAESPESSAGQSLAPRLRPSLNSQLSTPNSSAASAALATASLVVCPASLVENWRRETARFAPELRTFVHHGDSRLPSAEAVTAFDLVLTSYGTLARDRDLFSEHAWDVIIADEAQHLKNRRTQAAQSLRALRGRGRFLLTGTPLENSVDDLRSLFEFLLPGYIEPIPAGTRGADRTWMDERLRARTAPYLLRRTKVQVAPELPPKIEQVIYCELPPAQAAFYRDVQEKTERALAELDYSGASESQLRFATLTQLLRLRQVCCDPRLIAAESQVASAKLEAFRELLDECVDEGHRVLVFSQFTSLLALLRTELETQGLAYCYLDGSMTPRARQAEVDRFQAGDAALPVFLISLKAGGTGLNLTGADVVVHFDPWWNPAAEAQATDRAHRIGQTKVVTSYKLICSGTVEEKVLTLQEEKRRLLADVFEASDAANATLSVTDLRSLLK